MTMNTFTNSDSGAVVVVLLDVEIVDAVELVEELELVVVVVVVVSPPATYSTCPAT